MSTAPISLVKANCTNGQNIDAIDFRSETYRSTYSTRKKTTYTLYRMKIDSVSNHWFPSTPPIYLSFYCVFFLFSFSYSINFYWIEATDTVPRIVYCFWTMLEGVHHLILNNHVFFSNKSHHICFSMRTVSFFCCYRLCYRVPASGTEAAAEQKRNIIKDKTKTERKQCDWWRAKRA